MPELVSPGVTGLLVTDVESAVRAVAEVSVLDRAACRREALARFSSDRMVDDYVALFERVVQGRGVTC